MDRKCFKERRREAVQRMVMKEKSFEKKKSVKRLKENPQNETVQIQLTETRFENRTQKQTVQLRRAETHSQNHTQKQTVQHK